ncbi:hypothetical protein DBV15_02364 [Temnothorax longispinosus]|uniref:Uncharacterized protein n=1 Tax=Temnothorax longispinosus TaxID=300112 RepID=A0A4V6RG79_9HYME|nr:hypothetical protein DBV15_02364 [Temnothorax longispinosus]
MSFHPMIRQGRNARVCTRVVYDWCESEWDKQPNAIERHLDSIVTNVCRPSLNIPTPNTVTLANARQHVGMFVASRVRENSKTFVCDNKEACRVGVNVGVDIGVAVAVAPREKWGHARAAVVTLLECFQKETIAEEAPRTRECAAAYIKRKGKEFIRLAVIFT